MVKTEDLIVFRVAHARGSIYVVEQERMTYTEPVHDDILNFTVPAPPPSYEWKGVFSGSISDCYAYIQCRKEGLLTKEDEE